MPVLAMALVSVVSSSLSPARVLAARDGFQVVGVHASPVAAKVVELETGRDRPRERFISEAMRTYGSVSELELPVARAVSVRSPFDAAVSARTDLL